MNDRIKWGMIILLLTAGMVASYYYSDMAWALRVTGWIVLGCVLAAIAMQTASGQQFWAFAKDARAELRKVVWPTRPETIQTTAIVVV